MYTRVFVLFLAPRGLYLGVGDSLLPQAPALISCPPPPPPVAVAYGYWTNSLGLISDAVHMLFGSISRR